MNSPTLSQCLLFSIDTEEFYAASHEAGAPGASMVDLVGRYLDILNQCRCKGTFFIVGSFARKFPDIVKKINDAGHEVACHTNAHKALNLLSRAEFKQDLSANIDILQDLTGKRVHGFRAPIFSLTSKTAWAYEVMEECALSYSSSVLPAPNPLYGWPDFGSVPRRNGTILEIPISTSPTFAGRFLPLFGGTYFRIMPLWLIKRRLNQHKSSFVTSYFHPYDIDYAQKWCMSCGVNDSRLLNSLLFLRRRSAPRRIEKFIRQFQKSSTYLEFSREFSSEAASPLVRNLSEPGQSCTRQQ